MHSVCRYPSLELNWLPNSERKGLQTPQIVYTRNAESYGGCYFHSPYGKRRCIVGQLDLDVSRRPLIEICENRSSDWGDTLPGTIAHEFRHHWQRDRGELRSSSVFNPLGDYRARIVSFFTRYPWEMDALKYQLRVAPDDVAHQWMEWIDGHSAH